MFKQTGKSAFPLTLLGCSLLLAACNDRASPSTALDQPKLSDQAVVCRVWTASAVYLKGDTVSAGGVTYRANWWTQNNPPASNNGPAGSGQPWTVSSGCGGPVVPPPVTPPPVTPPPVTPPPVNPPPVNPPPVNPPPVNPPPVNPPPVSPPPVNGLARHALVGYWHAFSNPSGDTFAFSEVTSAWDVIVVAFADNAQNGNVSFTLDPKAGSEAQFIADIRAKQAQGKKVVLSLGGQNGSVTVNNQSEADNFANSLAAIIRKYGFNGIDLDLESGVATGTPILTYLPSAVKSLKAKIGNDFYLSMAPEWVYVEGGFTAFGGPWGAYLPMIEALRGDLTILHPQYYNNGGVYTPYSASALAAGSTDQLVATARMLIEGFQYGGKTFAGLRPDQVGMGVPSGPSSAGSGFTTPSNVNNALDCITKLQNCGSIRPNQAYPSFRGVMTWSINWDKHDGFNFSGPVGSHLRSLP